jgi:hypothetical protein
MSERTQVWSCGGGVQSAAIAALIIQRLLPKPDYSIIVDTEREKSTTWTYYDSVLRPELQKVGVDLERVLKSRYATVDLYSGNGDVLIPAHTRPAGQLDTYCSNEWKKRVVMRHCRELGVKVCQNWIGISIDEMQRVRTGPPAWFQPRYPLIFDTPMSRGACLQLVKRMGWPPAPRSSCWMCPHHDDSEWLEMTPEDMGKAVAFEREIQAHDANCYLHRSHQPIDQVDFKKRIESKDGCQTGFCFT